jgi:peroxiredoxin
MANDYKSKGVEVVGLTNEDPQQFGELVKDFSKQFKINYQVGFADPQMTVGLMNGRNGIPQTIIIGRDGKVKKHFVGFSAAISVPQMKAALDEAVSAT